MRSSINPDIQHSKVASSELKTLEWDIFNPVWLIQKFLAQVSSIVQIYEIPVPGVARGIKKRI